MGSPSPALRQARDGEGTPFPSPGKRWASFGRAPLEDRRPPLGDMTTALPDRDEITNALANVDPEGQQPPPEATIEAVDSWGPLRIGESPSVEPFPIDVLPQAVDRSGHGRGEVDRLSARFHRRSGPVRRGRGGRSLRVAVAQTGILRVIHDLDRKRRCPQRRQEPRLVDRERTASADRRVLPLEHEQAKERWTAESEMPGPDGKKPKPGPPPRPKRIDVNDVTMECLINLLADNPRGLVMVQDELAGFLSGMNQYKGGKGSDRAYRMQVVVE